ncbi:MAG: hypothetical protein WB561_02460 [Terracidiphilus sp.]
MPSRGIEYQFVIYENPHALPATKLPQSLLGQFKETFNCIVKGTDPRRPAPVQAGRPQQNGRHERMHRTLKEDTTKPPAEPL